ncbi:MFS transporter [Sphingobium xenophagum]|uniref:MFS transporter n=1 Tax=Sphingobium xenophagum TaxID=121428 RepID=UPI0006942A36|nr:MFS transporter [Sphingobium xenophagum]
MRKVRRRIVPLMVLLYVIAYIDRNNVGFAKPYMSEDLGLSNAAYGFGAGVFFIGYVLMEVPSNAGMYRFGARRWIARILISWGMLACAMALVTGETSFYVIRFLLGAAEAGFFPAVLFYFTLWFPAQQRVSVLGLFVMAQPVANAVGSPLSGLLLTLEGWGGWHGWQWMYVIEGLPAVVIGLLAPRLLTDRPSEATWLNSDERAWLVRTMDVEFAAKSVSSLHPFWTALKDPRAWTYGALNCGMACGIYGLGLWLPTIVAGMREYSGSSSTALGLLVMIPYAVAIPFVYHWARRAERTGLRALHASVSLGVAAFGLLGAGYLLSISPVLALTFLSIAATGIYSAIGPFLSMPSALYAGAAAAAGLGLMNSLGNIGGFVAPLVVGMIKDHTHNDQIALTFLATCLAVTAVCTYLFARRRPEGDAGIEAASIQAAARQPEISA